MSNRQRQVLELLDRSGAALHALLTRLTLRRDIAEELMQELFIKLDNARNGRKIDNWEAYARRAAINLAFDWRRKQKTPVLPLDKMSEPTSRDNSALGSLIEAEELEEMLDALGRLEETLRRVLVMRYIEQESYDHIAEQLGRSPHHVRALCSRAMGRLREGLWGGSAQSFHKETNDV